MPIHTALTLTKAKMGIMICANKPPRAIWAVLPPKPRVISDTSLVREDHSGQGETAGDRQYAS